MTCRWRSTELEALRRFEPRFAELCAEVAAESPGDSIQHDDLHVNGVFVLGDELRVMDWGDASIGHPFASLIVTFRFLERENGLSPDDPWFARLRDAYLEPWGTGLVPAFERAYRIAAFAHAIALDPPPRPALRPDEGRASTRNTRSSCAARLPG